MADLGTGDPGRDLQGVTVAPINRQRLVNLLENERDEHLRRTTRSRAAFEAADHCSAASR